ncbi:target of rapamycin complex 2 subunit MAPKAP1-like isoform X1 [Anarrhichthys ocellatus]|uniref:target of rapamycin complex 2 subunit MAPKAP1-like isoform X1 n=1 Tax=Anarrhichthys ocellatus TaxID=433405 RepID=UPI0012EDE9E4|nr:target of rapamycin complex 2 subunit MAPKAP1-like isoform X1 [Anarrhichthys ocellatus]
MKLCINDYKSCKTLRPSVLLSLLTHHSPTGPMYRLEKQTEPNVSVDLDSTLESQSTLEFCLVRENSSRGEESSEEDPPIDITTVQDMLSSHHYKSFKISMIHKLRFTTDVQLGVSGEKVEIDPVTNQKASTKFWIRQKPISIDSDHLCACDLVEERSPSHAIFKLTYLSNHDYKPLYFESDAATVNEIVLKVCSFSPSFYFLRATVQCWHELFLQLILQALMSSVPGRLRLNVYSSKVQFKCTSFLLEYFHFYRVSSFISPPYSSV